MVLPHTKAILVGVLFIGLLAANFFAWETVDFLTGFAGGGAAASAFLFFLTKPKKPVIKKA